MSTLNWQKWGLSFWQSLARHIGTAGMTWLGLGVKDGKVDWGNLWVAILVGAVLPSVFTFLQTTPTPEQIGQAELDKLMPTPPADPPKP